MIAGIWENYIEYLCSEVWQEKSIRMKTMYPECYFCKSKATEVHHKTYEHVGNEPQKDLLTLCKSCHITIHHEDQMR